MCLPNHHEALLRCEGFVHNGLDGSHRGTISYIDEANSSALPDRPHPPADFYARDTFTGLEFLEICECFHTLWPVTGNPYRVEPFGCISTPSPTPKSAVSAVCEHYIRVCNRVWISHMVVATTRL